MPSSQKEPQPMMDFILNRRDAEDEATASLIKPIPASVGPSAEFLASLRAQILSVTSADAGRQRAA
ncbi:MAG: hypothetical protein AB7T32_12220 [Dehalococcoidia bacterium]